MKTKQFKIFAILFAIGLTVFSSCKKPDPDSQSAEDNARGSYIMADAFAVSNSEAGGTDGKIAYPKGMQVVRNLTARTVTITFDSCDFRGKVRNGIIHVAYALHPDIGLRAVDLTITFENYYIDGIHVEGTIKTTFGGTYTKPAIHVIATNMKATFPDNKVLSWSSDKTFTMTSGYRTYTIDDNVIEISGTVNGTNRAGKEFHSVYDKVTLKRSCPDGYPVSGTVTITSDKGETVIDYGDGTCDDIITVSNNGVTLTIHLDQ
ncbi:MAG: hypothetical protein L3J56_08725 [Bacteroidales bacterium]|nr:hypothetical protein [Bacteroidales bacterium]